MSWSFSLSRLFVLSSLLAFVAHLLVFDTPFPSAIRRLMRTQSSQGSRWKDPLLLAALLCSPFSAALDFSRPGLQKATQASIVAFAVRLDAFCSLPLPPFSRLRAFTLISGQRGGS